MTDPNDTDTDTSDYTAETGDQTDTPTRLRDEIADEPHWVCLHCGHEVADGDASGHDCPETEHA